MPKATHRTDRDQVQKLTQIVNVGPSIADDLRLVGIRSPKDLIGSDAWQLYAKLIKKTKTFHDPCVLDTFISAVDYMNGNPPQAWWKFTEMRKRDFTDDIDKLRKYPR